MLLTFVMESVVTVPGLGGHALGSWKSPEGHEVWLRDFLPKDIKKARIIAYGYDTSLREANWKSTIYRMAISMLESLRDIRDRAVILSSFVVIAHEKSSDQPLV